MAGTKPEAQPEIVTPRLRLRPLRPRDAALIALYCSDRRVGWTTAMIPYPYPPGAAEAFIGAHGADLGVRSTLDVDAYLEGI